MEKTLEDVVNEDFINFDTNKPVESLLPNGGDYLVDWYYNVKSLPDYGNSLSWEVRVLENLENVSVPLVLFDNETHNDLAYVYAVSVGDETEGFPHRWSTNTDLGIDMLNFTPEQFTYLVRTEQSPEHHSQGLWCSPQMADYIGITYAVTFDDKVIRSNVKSEKPAVAWHTVDFDLRGYLYGGARGSKVNAILRTIYNKYSMEQDLFDEPHEGLIQGSLYCNHP